MIVTLTGYMGSGKSTVGEKLARLLGCEFIDLDRYIEDKTGRTIPDIFVKDGEKVFRAIEAEALRDLIVMHQLTDKDLVLALGGGTVMTVPLRELIFKQTKCVWLKADVSQLISRVGRGSGRPLADSNFEARLHERESVYAMASITIDTDGLSPDQVAMLIESELKKSTHDE